MEQAELEVQLNVWKDLAISKQVLMLSATKALGLDENCSAQELEAALTEVIAKGKNAAKEIAAAEEKASKAIADMEEKVKLAKLGKQEAVEARATAEEAKVASENKLAAVREATSKDVSEANTKMNDALKEMKRTQKLLADTPENVVKKLKQLKKEKMDESNARKRAEESNRKQRKELQQFEEAKRQLEKAEELAASYRELQNLANEQYAKLSELVEDSAELETVPEFDMSIVEALEGEVKEAEKAKAA